MVIIEHHKYWSDPPPVPSPSLNKWMARIKGGWRPNRRIQSLGYSGSAEFYNVYYYEYLNIIAPALQGD